MGNKKKARTKPRIHVPCKHVTWPAGIPVSAEPVRRIHTRSRRRNTSLIYSTLPPGMREADSQSEVLFLQVAELDPGVACIRAQPCWLRVMEDGSIHRRAPDFAVMYDGRAELHEVKQDAECWKPEVRSELLAIRDEVERHPRWCYSVSLESVLKAEPLRSNTETLWRALRPEEEVDWDLRLRTGDVLDGGPIAAAELIDRTRRPNAGPGSDGSWSNLLAMVAGRYVHFDVRERLTLDSLVWNLNAGPPRERTLPFGSVNAATTRPVQVRHFEPFCALQIRRLDEQCDLD